MRQDNRVMPTEHSVPEQAGKSRSRQKFNFTNFLAPLRPICKKYSDRGIQKE